MQGHRASSSTVQWASSSQLNRLSSSQLHRLSSSQGHRVSSSLGHRVSFHKDTGCLLYKDTGCLLYKDTWCLLYKNTGRLLYDTVCMSSIQVGSSCQGVFCMFYLGFSVSFGRSWKKPSMRQKISIHPGRNRFLQTESQPCFFS